MGENQGEAPHAVGGEGGEVEVLDHVDPVADAEALRHGVFVVENLDLEALAADGVREFALILTHPKLRGATGAWTSPIALV